MIGQSEQGKESDNDNKDLYHLPLLLVSSAWLFIALVLCRRRVVRASFDCSSMTDNFDHHSKMEDNDEDKWH